MKKLAAFLLVLALSLWAGDFWQSKPYSDWSDKDVDKMLHNSPWAKQVGVSVGGGGGMSSGGRGKGGRSTDISDASAGAGAGAGEMSTGGGGGGRSRGGGSGMDEIGAGSSAVNVMLSWESALPVRQAHVRAKYGSEATTSPEAKKLVDQDPDVYVILVSGPVLRGGAPGQSVEEMKKAVMEQTALLVKGKEGIKCNNIQMGRGQALFFFPKTAPLSLDDKEVEFATKVGPLPLRCKFRLKDMVFNGKLEL